MQLKSLVYLASVIATALGATVQDVLTDISAISSSLTTLDNAMKAFPNSGGTLFAASVIYQDIRFVESLVDTTISDVKNVPDPVAEGDCQNILAALEGQESIIDATLTDIVSKKPAFDALPLGVITGLILQALVDLSNSTATLDNTLLARSPADLVSEGSTLRNRISAAFSTAIAAYGD